MIKIKHELIQLTIVLMFVGVTACQRSSYSGTSIDTNNGTSIETKKVESETPYQIVEMFFQPSNDPESLKKLERTYPDRFTECLLETVQECSEKRQKAKQPKPLTNSKLPRFEISEENEVSLIIRDFSEKISNKSLTLKRKVSEWIKDDEARVRIEVEVDGVNEIKDFLLYKETNWQIFEIAREDEHLYFATPSSSSEFSL